MDFIFKFTLLFDSLIDRNSEGNFMKKYLFIMVATALFCTANMVWAGASKSTVPATPTYDTHPVPMGGNDCMYCHSADSVAEEKSGSNAGQEWEDSLHGINMVPCVTCHGDENTFLAASSMDKCVSCHPAETSVITRKTESQEGRLVCVNCHTAHSFTATKEDKPIHSK